MTDSGSNLKPLVHTKALILGAGPAGMAAALYTARAELKPVVITGSQYGGQAALTHMIENYPGFPEGVGGMQISELFQKQAERFGASFEFDTADKVDLSSRPFKISTYNQDFLTDVLIVATGARPNHLEVPGENRLIGKGVSYCGTCDGWFFKEKTVVVVGGGDSALEEAIFLTRYASSVTVIHRRNTFRAGQILQNRAKEANIRFIFDTIVTEISGDKEVKSVMLNNNKTGDISELATDGVFIFIGHTPNSELFSGQLNRDSEGYITSDKQMRTSVPGVFVAGEVCDPNFRQVITSAGMGAAAAIQASRFME